jgi:hypothetical protein
LEVHPKELIDFDFEIVKQRSVAFGPRFSLQSLTLFCNFALMDRRQKIIRLIIDKLAEDQLISYNFIGVVQTANANIISLDFSAKKGEAGGEFNSWGDIEDSFILKTQFGERSLLNDYPELKEDISNTISEVHAKINRLL